MKWIKLSENIPMTDSTKIHWRLDGEKINGNLYDVHGGTAFYVSNSDYDIPETDFDRLEYLDESESTAPVEGEWVRVDDRLPPFNENVIGYTKNGRKVMTFVDGSGKLDDQDIDENDCWTHWHKLPSPPNNSNGG